MRTIIELNKKYGYGYQARMIIGGLEDVLDGEPAKLNDIVTGLQDALDEINETRGTNYILEIDPQALEVNAIYDPYSACFLKYASPDMTFTAANMLKMLYETWKGAGDDTACSTLRNYCRYLALEGYRGNAHDIFKELKEKDRENAIKWLESTHAQYVKNDALMREYLISNVTK